MSKNKQNWNHSSHKEWHFGISGCGKTTNFEKIIRTEKAKIKFIFDWKQEFKDRFKYPTVETWDEIYAATERGGMVCFDPVKLYEGNFPKGFDDFSKYCYEAAKIIRGRKLFIVDDVHLLMPNRLRLQSFVSIGDAARTREIDIYAIAQSPNQVHTEIRNQITRFLTFKQGTAAACEYFVDNGIDENKILTMQRGQWIWRNNDTAEIKDGGSAF